MALSTRTKYYMKSALSDRTAAEELSDAVDAAEALNPAATVTAVSPSSIPTVTVPDNTQASINTALATVVASEQANRTALNAVIASLKAAGLMK